MKRIVLHHDPAVNCWLDRDGQAWAVAASKQCVDRVRSIMPGNTCRLCRRRFRSVQDRNLHMLNDCPIR